MRPADCVSFHVHVNLRKATKKRRAESLNPFEICEATVFAREWSKSLPVLSANNPINSGQLMQRSSEFSEASGLSALLKRFRAHSPNPSPQPTAHAPFAAFFSPKSLPYSHIFIKSLPYSALLHLKISGVPKSLPYSAFWKRSIQILTLLGAFAYENLGFRSILALLHPFEIQNLDVKISIFAEF